MSVLIVGACAGAIAAAIGCLLGGLWLWYERSRAACGTLEISVMQDGCQGRFRPRQRAAIQALASESAPAWVPLRCDYLGPWLIGLRLDGRRLWLWPDSASDEARRRVRRVFHHPGR